MVTWDPRGEFASGGILNVDSPAFEGQDVKGIIDWISDPAHVAYTFPAFDNDVTVTPTTHPNSTGMPIRRSAWSADPTAAAFNW